jgi:hypothetical protein
MKWPVKAFTDGQVIETTTEGGGTAPLTVFRVHWQPTVFELSNRQDTLFICIWAPSFVSKKDIIDRDSGLTILELERTQTANSEPTYTQSLLRNAMTNQSVGPFFLCPDRGITEEGPVRLAALAADDVTDLDIMPNVIPYDVAANRVRVIYATVPRFQPPRISQASAETHDAGQASKRRRVNK